MVKIGDVVKWDCGRKPLGTVVQVFSHKGDRFAVVEADGGHSTVGRLNVVRIYSALVVVHPAAGN